MLWMKNGWFPSIMDETWMLMDEIQPFCPKGSQDSVLFNMDGKMEVQGWNSSMMMLVMVMLGDVICGIQCSKFPTF